VPTVAEQANFRGEASMGLVVRSGTPPAFVERIKGIWRRR
jgi:hypothetical protein